MTYTYTFDNMIILQQIGSAYIDNATAIEVLKLNEQGWNCDAVHSYPEGNRCYVILSKPKSDHKIIACYDSFTPCCQVCGISLSEHSDSLPEKEAYEEIEAQWNLAMPYLAELWD